MTVQRLGEGSRAQVVDVIAEAFYDYPVTRFVIGRHREYGRHLRKLIDFFVMARFLRGELVLGLPGSEGLSAVALVSFPGRAAQSPLELERLRSDMWNELGPEARRRYEELGRVWQRFPVPVPHIHLNVLGVRRAEQGKGLGGKLVRAVTEACREEPTLEGVSLNTEDPKNVPLYRHLGFEEVGRARVRPGLETWVMFRRDAAGHEQTEIGEHE